MNCLRLPIFLLTLALLGCHAVPRTVKVDYQSDRGERIAYAEAHTYLVDVVDGHGSGWAWDTDTLVTARHVVPDEESALSCVIKQSGRTWRVVAVRYVDGRDIALLDVEGDDLEVMPRRRTAPIPGEWVTMAGYPLVPSFLCTEGAVIGRFLWRDWAIDGAVIPGMSGGPVIDSEGQVVGMMVATTLPPGRALGLFIPVTKR